MRMEESSTTSTLLTSETSNDTSFKKEVLNDFYISVMSRETSLMGRKEVLTGKAKFGILGDGKEVPQVAMARAFKKGDWRSGYYRDQTFMFAIGESTIEDYFAQLYADAENDPFSGGRQMNSHYATPIIDEDDNWLDLTDRYNISSDISCTGGQMARGLGLAFASKVYKNIGGFKGSEKHSKNGKEVCFVTIGDASTSEGPFWETVNSATVNKVPMLIAIWDDGYGISVPVEKQTAKGSISEALEGFATDENGEGMAIYRVKAWDYPGLCAVFEKAADVAREDSRPVLVHVQEVTQPQGHSTSGSHERYKSQERLEWEKEFDCILKMEEWLIKNNLATQEEVNEIKQKAKDDAKKGRDNAWKNIKTQVDQTKNRLIQIFATLDNKSESVDKLEKEVRNLISPVYSDIIKYARRLKQHLSIDGKAHPQELLDLLSDSESIAQKRYHLNLYSHSDKAAVNIPIIHPEYDDDSPKLNGYQIINSFFDTTLEHHPEVIAFGEDVGKIGDVNQGFAGLQEKYGEERVFDTGIREWSIMGMAIGTAMRGLRPIAEIQYLDYLLYGLSPLSDDLATLRYRSNGIQMAPAIIRTRGHRLEGVWHAGSPLGMMINSLRGMVIAVPRNMVQAAGIYNTLLQSSDPGIVIECLNGYRLKEKLPNNLGEFTVPLGTPEILTEGSDVTLVTYGSCIREAKKGMQMLEKVGISVELIDVQTLLPFDLEHIISSSLAKTNKIVFMDEDLPGGATGFMMKQVLEDQNGYALLDAAPLTISAKDHRTPFGSDGDYFTKPQAEDVFDVIYSMMKEYNPSRF